MRNTVLVMLLGLVISGSDLFAQQYVTAPETFNTYVITDVPSIRLVSSSNTYNIPIDNTKFCEYIMAALMTFPKPGAMEVVTNTDGTIRYRFLYQSIAIPAPVSGNIGTRLPSNFCGIGFSEKADGTLIFEVMLEDARTASYSSWDYYDFELSAGANYNDKIRFDYIVSAVLNFYELNNGSNAIMRRLEIFPSSSNGQFHIGRMIKMRDY